jgi:ankyrin repeat protein
MLSISDINNADHWLFQGDYMDYYEDISEHFMTNYNKLSYSEYNKTKTEYDTNLMIERCNYVNVRDIFNKTLLHMACIKNDIRMVDVLLLANSDIDCQDNDGITPIHIVVKNNNNKILCMLLMAGANINIRDNSGKTPLDIALEYGHRNIINILVQEDTNIAYENK